MAQAEPNPIWDKPVTKANEGLISSAKPVKA